MTMNTKMSKFLWFCTLLSVGLILIGPEILLAAPSKKARHQKKATETKPLIEKAAIELSKITKKNSSSSLNTNANGIFTVKEPELELTSRSYSYQVAAKIQKLQPTGKVHSSIVGDFDLNNYDPQIFPVLELGIAKDFQNPGSWKAWNLFGQLGYNSVKVPLIFPSGYRAAEATRLNTMRASLCAEFKRSVENFPELFLTTGIGIGKIFYTQTSFNDLAQFSESLPFGAINLGANYDWQKNLNLSANYAFRSGLKKSDLQIQNHNLEFGLKVLW